MRTVLHSDLNNFYASVECAYRPELKKVPLAVCGDPEARHGIILAKNNLAKGMGVQTGEAIWQAKQKCPDLQLVPPDFPKYVHFAHLMRDIYAEYTDYIEPFGLDEAWLDVTGHKKSGRQIADELRYRAKEELGLTLSVGVSFNKIFAKLGSDMKKPDATTEITPENYRERVWPLPVQELLFVGPATRRRLNSRNIHTIGDLAACDPSTLRSALGKNGEMIWNFARGNDHSPVLSLGEAAMVKSVGNSTTTPRDLKCDRDVRLVLLVLSESVAERLRSQGLQGDVVTLQVRSCDLEIISCQRKIIHPTALAEEIALHAQQLFRERYRWEKPIRSLGVSVSGLSSMDGDRQISMFPDTRRERLYDLEEAVGDIRRRFGHYAISRASLLSDADINGINPRDDHTIHPVGWRR